MSKSTCCTYPHCENPQDRGRDAAMCSEHSERWLRSKAFMAACRDEKVRFAMSLGLQTAALREVAKHRRRWAKQESAKEAGK